jgi:spermidine synthase
MNIDVFSQISLTLNKSIFILIACISAASIGIFFAKKQARAFKLGGCGAVAVFDYGDMRFLHLGSPTVQGSMRISKPFDIHLEYVQRMMAWLLFVDLEKLNQLHAMQLGLGAASLSKFCHHHLGMQTTAVEINPEVITTCQKWFNLPESSDTFQVIQEDALVIISDSQWHGRIDILQIDLYDEKTSTPELNSEKFYRNCRQLLTQDGCLTINIFGKNLNIDESLQRIFSVFGFESVFSFKTTKAGNTIVLAFNKPQTFEATNLLSQAKLVQSHWPLSATKWLKNLAPFKA